jgi:hypothetical protein
MVYAGSSKDILSYFHHTLHREMPIHENPADFVLDVLYGEGDDLDGGEEEAKEGEEDVSNSGDSISSEDPRLSHPSTTHSIKRPSLSTSVVSESSAPPPLISYTPNYSELFIASAAGQRLLADIATTLRANGEVRRSTDLSHAGASMRVGLGSRYQDDADKDKDSDGKSRCCRCRKQRADNGGRTTSRYPTSFSRQVRVLVHRTMTSVLRDMNATF